MVQEGVAWFSFKSATYRSQPVRVAGPTMPGSVAGPSSGVPASLPTTLSAPGRRQLWVAALRMIAAHPLFGVGPDAFRLNYGAYLVPRQQTWDERILANSLPLEIFADQGLVGGGLFFGLLAATVWPLLVVVWRRRVLAWWQIAVIGSVAAFLGHGLVDYMLFSDAIFFVFWLLCGLAATAAIGSRGPRLATPGDG
jgi:O-antigen ligase